jgi:uncharacterized repeat protein (TIGR03803 family)
MRNIHVQQAMKRGSLELFTFLLPGDRKSSYAPKVSWLRPACAIFLLCAATAIASPAATKFKSLVGFDNANGRNPDYASVIQGLDGNLYGTTEYGGANLPCNQAQVGCGTVFQITPGGKLTTLHSFCPPNQKVPCMDGAYPIGGVILANDGNLYGTTSGGGTHGAGIVFKITSAGKLTTVYNFCSQSGCVDGWDPNAPLIQGTDGNFYGVTVLGGTGGCGGCHGGGIAFRLTPAGKLTVLHDFCTGSCTDGANPSNPLVQGSDGNFYSVITGRSGYFDGDLFKMTLSGKLTVLYKFCSLSNCTDGAFPVGSLTQGADGAFYGTTSGGGAVSDSGSGTFYKITPAGKLTTLHSFDYTTKGNYGSLPLAGVVLGTDGNFYGTTYQGGMGCVFGCGTIFEMTPAGKLTTLHLFDGTDGAGPYGLFQDTSGSFYGATGSGGSNNIGTVFNVSVGLSPFVELLPNFGKVGKTIDILGQGFTGATGVSFDGVAASFNNVSDTYMTAVVPPGALTGTVTVTTFTASYKSSKIFLVTPQLSSFSPVSGVVGTVVQITGVSLTQTSNVTIGGKAATFTVISDTEVKATVPAGAKNGQKICIATAGGTACGGTFTVAPNILSFSPSSGSVGTTVTITGTTFTGTTKVTFGGVAATSFQVISDSEVKALVPTGAKTGKIQVTTPGGTATSATNFTVT